MRTITNLNGKWQFTLQGKSSNVDLPHTWNNLDGQDGREGYKRCVGRYEKMLEKCGGEIYLEVLAANSEAKVYINGSQIAVHRGGYSAFYVNLTGLLRKDENRLVIEVSNAPDDEIYPAMADFTFYGGLYRGVNLIRLSDTHFDVRENGKGVFVTPKKENGEWTLKVRANVKGASRDTRLVCEIFDASGGTVAKAEEAADVSDIVFKVDNPVLWQGIANPYLYTVKCSLYENGELLDEVSIETAFREIEIDADKGLFLNGRHLKIKGVSRHQDRENLGNAVTLKEHMEDIRLIKEIGANSVRLAHYQQSDDFYTLCDREGLLVWAEVPVISRFSKKRQENAKSQLTELIMQAYNHPSIFCWGIANEITIAGSSKGLEAALRELNTLAKSLDDTRLTTLAEVTMCGVDSPLNSITDILGYNHYFGWYMGTFRELDDWLEKWRAANPDKKLCLSEYGAEGILKYQSETPVQGDYSESYQAVYHENYLKRINSCEWLWGSYVWNMFDFGSAARNEGGVRGRNNKGLVTFDRTIKKDAFYLYKAYWSKEPFVHIAGSRFAKRPIGKTSVKIYSNIDNVTLNVNGEIFTQKGDKVFIFDNLTIESGKNIISAHAGSCLADIIVEGVEEYPSEYILPSGERGFIRNWFDGGEGEFKPDYFSIDDKAGVLLKNPEVVALLRKFAGKRADSFLLNLIKPFKVRTLLKFPLLGVGEEAAELVNSYLQTIKK